MNKFILDVRHGQANTAGVKAKQDITQILTKNGYKELSFAVRDTKIAKLIMTGHDWSKTLKRVNTGDMVVLQYPMYSRFAGNIFFKTVKKLNLQITKVAVIHDIEALRLYKDDDKKIAEELNFLNQFDTLIVHNEKMMKWLLDNGIKINMISLEIFDYVNSNPMIAASFEKPLVFAGNLKKSSFLEEFEVKKRTELFGIEPSEKYPDNIHYNGVKTPEELPKFLDGSFGLVWDGESLETNTGIYGEYTRYNNPHKVSLYLSSGLPVIVWKEAAIASFIQNNKLGIVIENLGDIDNTLNRVTKVQYNEMKNNVEEISKRLRTGQSILNALKRIV
ncbi:sugar transferase [Latilactobacillus sakei]|uniref:sugar transferase n=1 Tax=Latilactobacillus sakei TaxID=1599 RepID=UPI003F52C961